MFAWNHTCHVFLTALTQTSTLVYQIFLACLYYQVYFIAKMLYLIFILVWFRVTCYSQNDFASKCCFLTVFHLSLHVHVKVYNLFILLHAQYLWWYITVNLNMYVYELILVSFYRVCKDSFQKFKINFQMMIKLSNIYTHYSSTWHVL